MGESCDIEHFEKVLGAQLEIGRLRPHPSELERHRALLRALHAARSASRAPGAKIDAVKLRTAMLIRPLLEELVTKLSGIDDVVTPFGRPKRAPKEPSAFRLAESPRDA